jgi:hypothetical protein
MILSHHDSLLWPDLYYEVTLPLAEIVPHLWTVSWFPCFLIWTFTYMMTYPPAALRKEHKKST